MPPEIEDRGAYCFCPVCHSVLPVLLSSTKNFNLGYNFWIAGTSALKFYMSVIPFCGYKKIWPCDFDLGVWSTYQKLNLGYIFWMVGIRALTFHMSIPCNKTFSLRPWPWCLTYLLKTLILAISFERYVLGLWYFTWVFLLASPFHWYKQIRPCDLDIGVWPTYWKL
jgi:hypothetical protein